MIDNTIVDAARFKARAAALAYNLATEVYARAVHVGIDADAARAAYAVARDAYDAATTAYDAARAARDAAAYAAVRAARAKRVP